MDTTKRELTITLDAQLFAQIQRRANARSMTLAALVEGILKRMAEQDAESFSTRWRGRFEAAHQDDPRYEALDRKYL